MNCKERRGRQNKRVKLVWKVKREEESKNNKQVVKKGEGDKIRELN